MARAAMVSSDASRIAHAIPEYEVERELGRGGMGVVYLGRHRRLDRGVAIKELPSSFAVDPAVRERFSTEAQTLAGLSHPHIVPIFDYVERDGLCLIVMEQLPGGSVWDRFTSTGLTPPTAAAVVVACCAALNYAHGKGVLHLDVKPDNLMFDAESAVKVTDFGIARVITGDRTLGTVDGQVLGTPAYMSPEQARGDALTPASDVYATGVMLYELLSGSLPWLGATTASELLQQRLNEDPVPLRQAAAHVPIPLETVVMHALSRDADQRFQGAEDLGVAVGEACVEAWGPSWLDHSGVAIFGSERLSRATRTSTSRAPMGSPATGLRTSGDQRVTTGGSRANETVTTGGRDSGARGTVISGAHETTVSGSHGPVSGAHETTVSGSRGPVSGAHETTVSGSHGTVSGAHETTVSGSHGTVSGAHETTASGPQRPVGGTARETTVSGAHETTVSGSQPPASTGGARETVAPAGPGTPGHGTAAPQPPTSDGDGPVSRVVGPPPPAPDAGSTADPMFQVVKAAGDGDQRIEGIDLYRLEVADLIGVEDVLDPPKPPWTALSWAVSLVLLAVVVALVGVGGAGRSADGLEPGEVTVDGQDAASGGRLDLDLGEPIPVQIDERRLAGRADEVDLAFAYGGVVVNRASGSVRDGQATIEPGLAKRMVGGEASATLTVRTHGRTLATQDLAVQATQTWHLTVPFIGGLLLLLLGYANLESSLKPLRSGRTRRLSYVGAFFAGPPLAAGIVLVVGALGLREPTLPTLVVAALLCAGAGLPAVNARVGVARTRRVRQAVRRAERTLGVTARTTARPPAA